MTKITFIRGSLKGRTLEFEPGSTHSAGRSHACELHCSEDDVSGRHVRFDTGLDGIVSMTVESRYGAFVNGAKVAQGETVELRSGDEVRLGKSIEFSVEADADDDQTVLAPGETTLMQRSFSGFMVDRTMLPRSEPDHGAPIRPPEPAETSARTVARGDAGTVAGGETIALKTLAGSDEDIEKIKREYKTRRRNRLLAWIVPSATAFAALVAAYFAIKPTPEEYTSWPRDDGGKFLNKYVLVEPFLAVCVPDVPAFESVDTQSGKRIASALGRDRDIPLAVAVDRVEDKGLLVMDQAEAFERHLSERRERDTMFSTGSNRIRKFLCTTVGAGIPVSYIDYVRRAGAEEFFGYLVYLRRADVAYAISIEVPLAAQWRAGDFIAANLDAFVLYAPKRVPEHWEGGGWFRRETPVARDLDEAKNYLVRSKSPMNWEKGLYCLKSALIKGTQQGDAASVKEAEDLLVKLRARQSDWYNTCKLGYLQARVANDKERMQSLQSMCESVFTAAFKDCDYRYDRIKRKDWR